MHDTTTERYTNTHLNHVPEWCYGLSSRRAPIDFHQYGTRLHDGFEPKDANSRRPTNRACKSVYLSVQSSPATEAPSSKTKTHTTHTHNASVRFLNHPLRRYYIELHVAIPQGTLEMELHHMMRHDLTAGCVLCYEQLPRVFA